MAGRNLFAEGQAPTSVPVEQQPSTGVNLIQPAAAPPPSAALTRQAQETGPVEAGFVAMGKGLTGIGRAIGLVDPATDFEKQAFAELEKEQPIATGVGEVVGETLPFLAPGVAIGAIPGLAARTAAATVLGMTEGGLITKARGGDDAEILKGVGVGGVIGGTLEVAFPVIGRLGGSLIRRILGKAPKDAVLDSAGRPSAELKEALDKSGFTFEDLTQEAVEQLKATKPGADPQQAARLARLESLGAPATKGDIMTPGGPGSFAQKAEEARLIESAADTAGDPLRALRAEQARAFSGQLDAQIKKLGVPDEVGDTIKSALEGRKKLLTAEKNALYKQVAETAPEIKNAPILTSSISDAIPSDDTLADLAITAGDDAIEKVDNLLVKFGINKNPEDVERFLSKTFRGRQATIDPLNIGNFDRFRKSLNAIDDPTRALSVFTQPIKTALDEEAGLIDDALRAAGIADESILAPLKAARATVRQIKTEFSPEAISGRLIKVKRDGATPLIESSKVFNELMGTNKAPELLERTIESLSKTPAGKKAIGDLQARTLVDLLDHAFKAKSNVVGEQVLFGSRAFNKRLEQIGERRLNSLFSTRPDVLKKLNLVVEAAKDITPPAGAMPKGSASVLLDALNKLGIMTIMGKIPVGGQVVAATIQKIADAGADRAVLEKALKATPNVKRISTFIANDAPSLAAVLGISFLAEEKEPE